MSQTGNEISFLPIQELSTGRNTWDWIPLNLFLLCANEKKKKKKKKEKEWLKVSWLPNITIT